MYMFVNPKVNQYIVGNWLGSFSFYLYLVDPKVRILTKNYFRLENGPIYILKWSSKNWECQKNIATTTTLTSTTATVTPITPWSLVVPTEVKLFHNMIMSEKNRNNKQSKNENSDNSLFLWLLVVPTEVKTCYFTRLAKSESLHACNVLRGFPSWFWTFKLNETSYITMISLIFCIFKKLTSDLVRCIYLVRRFVWIFCIEYTYVCLLTLEYIASAEYIPLILDPIDPLTHFLF